MSRTWGVSRAVKHILAVTVCDSGLGGCSLDQIPPDQQDASSNPIVEEDGEIVYKRRSLDSSQMLAEVACMNSNTQVRFNRCVLPSVIPPSLFNVESITLIDTDFNPENMEDIQVKGDRFDLFEFRMLRRTLHQSFTHLLDPLGGCQYTLSAVKTDSRDCIVQLLRNQPESDSASLTLEDMPIADLVMQELPDACRTMAYYSMISFADLGFSKENINEILYMVSRYNRFIKDFKIAEEIFFPFPSGLSSYFHIL